MLSSTAAPSAGSTMGFIGASGATPRTRRVPPTTELNTGAATSPPKYFPADGSSIITATMMRGADAGAKPTNEARYFFSA